MAAWRAVDVGTPIEHRLPRMTRRVYREGAFLATRPVALARIAARRLGVAETRSIRRLPSLLLRPGLSLRLLLLRNLWLERIKLVLGMLSKALIDPPLRLMRLLCLSRLRIRGCVLRLLRLLHTRHVPPTMRSGNDLRVRGFLRLLHATCLGLCARLPLVMLLRRLLALHRALLAHVLLWLLLRSLTLDPLLRLTLRISLCWRLAQRTLRPLMLVCRCLRSRVMRRALVVVLLACLLGSSCTFQALGVRAWTLATKTPLHVRLGLPPPSGLLRRRSSSC